MERLFLPIGCNAADIRYGLDDTVAMVSQQFRCLACLVQTESMGDHKIRIDPACADQLDYGIDTFILAPDVHKNESFSPGVQEFLSFP